MARSITCVESWSIGRKTGQMFRVLGASSSDYVPRPWSYNHVDRLTMDALTPPGTGTVTLATYAYDDLGRFSSRKFAGNMTNAESYTYGSDISSSGWKRSSNDTRKGYDFTYDGLHRLKNATYKEGTTVNNHYTEKVTGYDRNGNITTLQRYGRIGASSWGVVDNLTLTRTGNQLTSVTDGGSAVYGGDFNAAAGASTYNANGALATDSGRGISSITWNEIDLPQTVTFSTGSTINYYYAADGSKLREVRAVVAGGSTTTTTIIDWCGDLVLEKVGNGTRATKRLRLDGGYVDLATGVTARRYFVRDHLGSVRAVVNDTGTVLETDDYYPLGGPLPTGTSTALQPEKYQGKEWNPAASFNVYDFGARLYDPALGRWISQDPLAEKYYPQSPYLFCAGNPLRFVDPKGTEIDWYRNNETGIAEFFEGGGEIEGYSRIGESISVFNAEDGGFDNYYQNVKVSTTDMPVNAKQQILSDKGMTGRYLSSQSGLSDYSRNSLLTGSIHQGQQDFLNHPVTQTVITNLFGIILSGIGGTVSSSISFYRAQQNSFNSYHYAERVFQRAVQDPLFHDFPKQLDKLIMKSKPVVRPDGFRLYKASGSINNTLGNYEIGIYNGQITHRFFNPIK